MKIGVKVSVFNYNFKNRRNELGISQMELAELSHVSIECIQRIERLEMPAKTIQKCMEIFNRLASELDSGFGMLFPQDYLDMIQQNLLPRRRLPLLWERDVDINSIPSSHPAILLESPELSYSADEISKMLPETLRHAMIELSDREKFVLRNRFGLDGNDPKTHSEIGKMLRVTKERVGQVERTALAKLRHPSRSKPLRALL